MTDYAAAALERMPRRLRLLGARARSWRSELFQLREFHAQFSRRGRVDGPVRSSYLSDASGVVEPSPPLVTLAEAFGGDHEPPEVLLLGDSSSLFVSRFDVSRRPLLEITARRLAPLRTCVVAHFGWHLGVHRGIVQAVASLPCRPRVVVLPVNLRQFSPQWAENPNFQFTDLMRAAVDFSVDPSGGVPAVPPFPRGDLTRGQNADADAWGRFRSVRVPCAWRSQETIGDHLDLIVTSPADATARSQRLRDVFAFHWLPGDKPERVHALGDAVRIAESFGARVVVQLSPINCDAGTRFIGAPFEDLIAQRIDDVTRVCRDAVRDRDQFVLEDLTHLLPSERFFYEADPTEHYDEIGRAAVAARTARAVQRSIESTTHSPANRVATRPGVHG